jgi:purine-binding chemotaxis protein CheW
MSAAFKDPDLFGPAQTRPLQVVTFNIDDRLFGTVVGSVREIRGWQPATALPNSESHVVGVLNLRGSIIAVYDLRVLLGLARTEPSRSTVTIVADVGSRLIGILADAVSDILDVDNDSIREPPPDGGSGQDRLLDKLIVQDEKVISLLNLGAIVGSGG